MSVLRNFQPIPAADFRVLGLPDVAYIKEVNSGGHVLVSLNAADGQQIAIVQTRNQATALALQNGLVPLTVH